MQGRPILTPDQLAAHKAFLANQNDVIWQPLYDYQTYDGAAGHRQLSFFSQKIGQGTTSAPGATGVKTLSDTNMLTAGQLPANNEFYCVGVEVLFFPGIDVGRGSVAVADVGEFVDDVYTIGKSGVLTLNVQNRPYIQDGPLGLFPEQSRLALSSSLSVTFDSDSTAGEVVEEVAYACFSGEPYSITPIYIVPNQAFSVTLDWPAAVVLPSGQDARIGVRLAGNLIRTAQ